ncbi:hypothetical protein BDQ17DRAFT_1418762 [Cyathus striatus]|nr:hypothetical protein BDQ17DRAFT_1418762 [Cyathus striatus]
MPFMTHVDHHKISFLVILSARALGSLGFGLSVLAIWIGWIIPASPPPTVALSPQPKLTPPRDKSRRRSAPSALPSQSTSPSPTPLSHASASAPAPVPPILAPSTDAAPNRARHVYFIDSDFRPSPLRRSTLPAYPTHLISDKAILDPPPAPPTNSPISSTSTLINPVHSDASPKKPYFEPCDEELVQSDSAQLLTRGRRTTPRLPRMKITFHGMGRRTTTADSSLSPVVDSPINEEPVKPVKRANTVPWCTSKNKLNPDPIPEPNRKPTSSRLSFTRCLNSRSTPSTSPAPVSTPTLTSTPSPSSTSFFLKPQRRTSAPVRRTLPYEAPYFASPPLILEDKNDRPQTRSFRGKPTSTASDNDQEFGVVRKDRKYASTTSKTAIATAIPRRRSVSLDLGERPQLQ